MKTKLILIVAVFYSSGLLGQTDDQQWYIINQFGKMGEETALGTDLDNNIIIGPFTIEGVSVPDKRNDPEAGNDLFIIFKDGNHYSSRFENRTEVFFDGPYDPNEVHHFNFSSGAIGYAYLTNKYEKDDPPKNIKITNTPTLEASVNNIIPNVPALLSANHNAVFNRDITVVVNYELLKSHFRGKEMPEVRLRYSGFEMIDGPGKGDTDIFDPSPVFIDPADRSVPEYPIGTLTPSDNPEEVIIEAGDDEYRYFNLRTTENALQFAPREDSSAQYNAIFSLVVNDRIISSIAEPLTFAYDPNFIRVDSICRNSGFDYHVYYHLEFENTGDAQVTDYKARFKFPGHFDFSCFEVLKWGASGDTCVGVATVDADSVVFDFNCDTPLFLAAADPGAAIAYVEFRVKIPAPYLVEDPTKSIKFNEPKTNFAGIDFDLKEFRDKIVADSSNKAYRPVLHLECSFCEKPPINWLFVLLGLAILAFMFFVKPGWLIKKPKVEDVRKV